MACRWNRKILEIRKITIHNFHDFEVVIENRVVYSEGAPTDNPFRKLFVWKYKVILSNIDLLNYQTGAN